MGTFSLRSHFCFTKPSILTYIIPTKTTAQLKKHPTNPSSIQNLTITKQKQSHLQKPLVLEKENKNSVQNPLIIGAVSVGIVLFLLGFDEQKALALGPEGPLLEEFWDNMRRYGLFVLTVSTGVAAAILEPILELLRNPITAILIVVIFGGSFYIVSQVLSAMVGVSEFNYQYGN